MYNIPFELSALPYVGAVLAIFSLSLGLLAITYFHATTEDTRAVRAYLQRRVGKMRLGRMLQRIGLSPQQYAQRAPIPQLRDQLRVCADCACHSHCDWILERCDSAVSELKFCLNLASINAVVANDSCLGMSIPLRRVA